MIIDQIKELLKQNELNIEIIKAYWSNSNIDEQLKELEEISGKENFWQNPNQTPILKELQRTKSISNDYHILIASKNELEELTELFASDENELEKLLIEVKIWSKSIIRFKLNMLLPNPDDKSNCFFSINAGAGGTESQDWAEMLLRMYLRFCEREDLKADLIDYQAGEAAGIKSATLFIQGKNCFGLLKSEQGVHRLVRISPYDANKRRHTSFAAVTVIPELPQVEIVINPEDLRIDTYRAGGAGGQHVNKTESAVRITHLPSGIVVQCQNDRSQIKNREIAMKMLMSKLIQKQKEEEQAKKNSGEKKKIEWGSQIRSYILHPYKLVKDHRTDKESQQPELVLDGEIMPFIESYLVKNPEQ